MCTCPPSHLLPCSPSPSSPSSALQIIIAFRPCFFTVVCLPFFDLLPLLKVLPPSPTDLPCSPLDLPPVFSPPLPYEILIICLFLTVACLPCPFYSCRIVLSPSPTFFLSLKLARHSLLYLTDYNYTFNTYFHCCLPAFSHPLFLLVLPSFYFLLLIMHPIRLPAAYGL